MTPKQLKHFHAAYSKYLKGLVAECRSRIEELDHDDGTDDQPVPIVRGSRVVTDIRKDIDLWIWTPTKILEIPGFSADELQDPQLMYELLDNFVCNWNPGWWLQDVDLDEDENGLLLYVVYCIGKA